MISGILAATAISLILRQLMQQPVYSVATVRRLLRRYEVIRSFVSSASLASAQVLAPVPFEDGKPVQLPDGVHEGRAQL